MSSSVYMGAGGNAPPSGAASVYLGSGGGGGAGKPPPRPPAGGGTGAASVYLGGPTSGAAGAPGNASVYFGGPSSQFQNPKYLFFSITSIPIFISAGTAPRPAGQQGPVAPLGTSTAFTGQGGAGKKSFANR